MITVVLIWGVLIQTIWACATQSYEFDNVENLPKITNHFDTLALDFKSEVVLKNGNIKKNNNIYFFSLNDSEYWYNYNFLEKRFVFYLAPTGCKPKTKKILLHAYGQSRSFNGYDAQEVVNGYAHDLENILKAKGYEVYFDDNKINLKNLIHWDNASLDLVIYFYIAKDKTPFKSGQAVFILDDINNARSQARVLAAELNNHYDFNQAVAYAKNQYLVFYDIKRALNNTLSRKFAHLVYNKMHSNIKYETVLSLPFLGLTLINTPGILLELGSMADNGDVMTITKPSYRKKTVLLLSDAVDEYFDMVNK